MKTTKCASNTVEFSRSKSHGPRAVLDSLFVPSIESEPADAGRYNSKSNISTRASSYIPLDCDQQTRTTPFHHPSNLNLIRRPSLVEPSVLTFGSSISRRVLNEEAGHLRETSDRNSNPAKVYQARALQSDRRLAEMAGHLEAIESRVAMTRLEAITALDKEMVL